MPCPPSAPTPSLEQSRRAFLARIGQPAYQVSPTERPMYEAALDDFIAWSLGHADRLHHHDAEYDQNVVSFSDAVGGIVFWSAYPKLVEGAKLELLPGAADRLPLDLRRHAVAELLAVSAREPLGDGTTLRVSFRALKSPARRTRVKALMATLLTAAQGHSDYKPDR